ncbi:MAG: phospho-N-acetylmuramoyl-pentapeptide-transferase, partial [Muribaculaceae bacterium]|nr:phospho-N-acetylmuramoyl-pentapeptide-transferase [Muribaculaceae bacterium]
MLYSLFQYIQEGGGIPGSRLMGYLTVRSVLALLLSLFLATVIGRRIIDRLQIMQVGEMVRNLG